MGFFKANENNYMMKQIKCKSLINITWLKISTGRRQTSRLFTNIAKELSSRATEF